MLASRLLTEQQSIIRRYFIDFFESERYERKYQQRIQHMMSVGGVRLIMDMGDLLDYVPATPAAEYKMGGGENDGEGMGFTPMEQALLLLAEDTGGAGWGVDSIGGGQGGSGSTSRLSLGVRLLYRPGRYLPLLELALHDMLLRLQPEYLKVDYRSRVVHVGFDGPVGQLRSPRELYARHLNTMVAMEGIITRQSANRPRVIESVHYCPATNRFTRREFRDQLTPMMDSSHLPTVNVMPKNDMEGNPLRTELGLSVFRDSQCAILQEAPERSPTGQLPRQVELRFDDDLVDRVKPGDRVVVVGVYMPYTTSEAKTTVQSILLVNHVVNTAVGAAGGRERKRSELRPTAVRARREMDGVPSSTTTAHGATSLDGVKPLRQGTDGEEGVEGDALWESLYTTFDEGLPTHGEEGHGEPDPRQPAPSKVVLLRPVTALEERLVVFARKITAMEGPTGILRALSKSIAPTIYGLSTEKSAILLLLVGGVERRAHHSHIRGDINILLVGEPSTAKSQLLRFVLFLSPLALSTTGKGSSGVGLTAAVTVDSYTGERSLSAGAMVLADRGILCVDEFDKMSPQDRVAMHEAMEQQTVTIAKAGIHASLNARCSVLAAANPIYGFYSVQHRLSFNVGLPESLLSRFDLMFIILDQHSSDYNRRIGSYILRNHMVSPPVGLDPGHQAIQTIVQRPPGASEGGHGGGRDGEEDEDENGRQGREEGRRDLRDSFSSSSIGLPDIFSPTTNSNGERIASVPFLQAYIQFAKQGVPRLTEKSQQLVSSYYVQLRAEQQQQQQQDASSRDGFFVTARTLEAIIRLSTAHAKLRLSPLVEEEDVQLAMELLRASVYAATSASVVRAKDNQQAMEPILSAAPMGSRNAMEKEGKCREGGAGRSIPMSDDSFPTSTVSHHGKHVRTSMEAQETYTSPLSRRRIEREEETHSATGDEEANAPTRSIPGSTMLNVLRRLQREQRSTVSITEVRQRLLDTGLFFSPFADIGAASSLAVDGEGLASASLDNRGSSHQDVLWSTVDPFLPLEEAVESEKGKEQLSIASVRAALKAMQGDVFVFDSADEGGKDVVQFI